MSLSFPDLRGVFSAEILLAHMPMKGIGSSAMVIPGDIPSLICKEDANACG
jgi:hypothetical protein